MDGGIVETFTYFTLIPMVYIGVGVFIAGTVYQLAVIMRHPRNPSSLQIFPAKKPAWLYAFGDAFLFPTVRRHKPVLWFFLMAFHIGLVLLLIGHLEVVADFKIIQIIPHDIFLGKGFLGLTLAVCLIAFLGRRFMSPVRELSIPQDYLLLLLLLLIVLFGSQMDWARNWYGYGEMDVPDYQEYLSSLVAFNPSLPDATLFTGHSFMLVVHIFLANLFLMVFPFTHLMHGFLSLSVNKLRRG
jgi:[DsrC]-trisulfide reductase subunit M